jgi:glycosyltransferase involved in cell wall biosynthesis
LGNDLIVQAAATLAREIPGFELHIIGGGDNMPELLKMTRSLGLEQIVQFHKPVPWDALAKKLSIMDAGIVANRANVATQLMLPAKLIDYVVLGIPAIVPRLKAIQYYFSPEMVSYFDPANVDSIIATTISLYQDKGRRERQAINAKTFLYENAWDLPGNGVKAVYEELFKDEAGNLRHTPLGLGTGRALLPNKGEKL